MSRYILRRITLLGGLVLGLVLGLIYTWVINPVELTNTYPALLRSDHRRDWIRLTALSYVADGDLDRAQRRLSELEQETIAEALEALIEEYTAAGRSADTLRRLTTLAQALDVQTPAMLVYLKTTVSPPPTLTPTLTPSATPTLTFTPTPSPTATPTPTPTPTLTPTPEVTGTVPTPTPTATLTPSPTPPFLERLTVIEKEQLCDPANAQPFRIEVLMQDEDGDGVPGVELWLTWAEGADRAVTGLKPDEGPGYADFNVDPETTYAISVGELGLPLISNLQLEDCPIEEAAEEDAEENLAPDEDIAPIIGSWRIVIAP